MSSPSSDTPTQTVADKMALNDQKHAHNKEYFDDIVIIMKWVLAVVFVLAGLYQFIPDLIK